MPVSILNKVFIFDKVSYGKKGFNYFIGQENDHKIKPLCIILPKMSGC